MEAKENKTMDNNLKIERGQLMLSKTESFIELHKIYRDALDEYINYCTAKRLQGKLVEMGYSEREITVLRDYLSYVEHTTYYLKELRNTLEEVPTFQKEWEELV